LTAERTRARCTTNLHDADATCAARIFEACGPPIWSADAAAHAAARNVEIVSTKKNPAARGAAGSW